MAKIKGKMEKCIKHLINIRNWSRLDVENHIKDGFIIYENRNNIDWITNWKILYKSDLKEKIEKN